MWQGSSTCKHNAFGKKKDDLNSERIFRKRKIIRVVQISAMSSVVSSHVKRFVCIKKKDHNRDNYMTCTNKCHCLALNTRTQFRSSHQDRKSRNKRQCREEPRTLEAQDRLAVEQKGNYRKYLQRFRRLHVFVLERKKNNHTTHTKKHTIYENYMLVLEYMKVSAMHLKQIFWF